MDNDLLFPVKHHRVAPVVGWSVGVGVVAWLLFSWPGLPWVAIAPAVLAMAIMGLAWLVLAVRSVSRPAQRGPAVAAAVVLAVALGGIGLHLPLTARFAVSQPSFQALVDEAGPPPTTGAELADSESSVRCPGRVGLYAVDSCRTTTGGYLFFDSLGNAAVDYAGFAYLPNGPSLDSDGGFELQELNHLQGPWYAFVASW